MSGFSFNTKIDKLTDQEILEAWFNGAFTSPRFHGGKSLPKKTPELERFMIQEYLAGWRQIAPARLGRLVTKMNEFWYAYKDDPNPPWLGVMS